MSYCLVLNAWTWTLCNQRAVNSDDRGDLHFGPHDGQTMYLRAIDGASLLFLPIEDAAPNSLQNDLQNWIERKTLWKSGLWTRDFSAAFWPILYVMLIACFVGGRERETVEFGRLDWSYRVGRFAVGKVFNWAWDIKCSCDLCSAFWADFLTLSQTKRMHDESIIDKRAPRWER